MNCKKSIQMIKRTLTFMLSLAMVITSLYVAPVAYAVEGDEVVVEEEIIPEEADVTEEEAEAAEATVEPEYAETRPDNYNPTDVIAANVRVRADNSKPYKEGSYGLAGAVEQGTGDDAGWYIVKLKAEDLEAHIGAGANNKSVPWVGIGVPNVERKVSFESGYKKNALKNDSGDGQQSKNEEDENTPAVLGGDEYRTFYFDAASKSIVDNRYYLKVTVGEAPGAEEYKYVIDVSNVKIKGVDDVVAAPLADDNGKTGLSATYCIASDAITYAGGNLVKVNMTGTAIEKHKATQGSKTEGYWVGIGVPHVVGNQYFASDEDKEIGTISEGWSTAITNSNKEDYKVGEKNYDTAYFNVKPDSAKEQREKVYLYVKNDTTNTYIKYEINLGGVTINERQTATIKKVETPATDDADFTLTSADGVVTASEILSAVKVVDGSTALPVDGDGKYDGELALGLTVKKDSTDVPMTGEDAGIKETGTYTATFTLDANDKARVLKDGSVEFKVDSSRIASATASGSINVPKEGLTWDVLAGKIQRVLEGQVKATLDNGSEITDIIWDATGSYSGEGEIYYLAEFTRADGGALESSDTTKLVESAVTGSVKVNVKVSSGPIVEGAYGELYDDFAVAEVTIKTTPVDSGAYEDMVVTTKAISNDKELKDAIESVKVYLAGEKNAYAGVGSELPISAPSANQKFYLWEASFNPEAVTWANNGQTVTATVTIKEYTAISDGNDGYKWPAKTAVTNPIDSRTVTFKILPAVGDATDVHIVRDAKDEKGKDVSFEIQDYKAGATRDADLKKALKNKLFETVYEYNDETKSYDKTNRLSVRYMSKDGKEEILAVSDTTVKERPENGYPTTGNDAKAVDEWNYVLTPSFSSSAYREKGSAGFKIELYHTVIVANDNEATKATKPFIVKMDNKYFDSSEGGSASIDVVPVAGTYDDVEFYLSDEIDSIAQSSGETMYNKIKELAFNSTKLYFWNDKLGKDVKAPADYTGKDAPVFTAAGDPIYAWELVSVSVDGTTKTKKADIVDLLDDLDTYENGNKIVDIVVNVTEYSYSESDANKTAKVVKLNSSEGADSVEVYPGDKTDVSYTASDGTRGTLNNGGKSYRVGAMLKDPDLATLKGLSVPTWYYTDDSGKENAWDPATDPIVKGLSIYGTVIADGALTPDGDSGVSYKLKGIPNYTYTGAAIKPSIVVVDNNDKVVPKKNYKVTITDKDNKKVSSAKNEGTYKVSVVVNKTVTLPDLTFTVSKAPIASANTIGHKSIVKKDKKTASLPVIKTLKNGKLVAKLGTDYTYAIAGPAAVENGTVNDSKGAKAAKFDTAGLYTVTITGTGNGNFGTGTTNITVNVVDQKVMLDKATITFGPKNGTLGQNPQNMPTTITVKMKGGTSFEGTWDPDNKNYDWAYDVATYPTINIKVDPSGNSGSYAVNPGKKNITVSATGTAGPFYGSKTKAYTIKGGKKITGKTIKAGTFLKKLPAVPYDGEAWTLDRIYHEVTNVTKPNPAGATAPAIKTNYADFVAALYASTGLVYGDDYNISYKGNNKVGTAVVTITAKSGSGYVGSTSVKFKIKKVDLKKNAYTPAKPAVGTTPAQSAKAGVKLISQTDWESKSVEELLGGDLVRDTTTGKVELSAAGKGKLIEYVTKVNANGSEDAKAMSLDTDYSISYSNNTEKAYSGTKPMIITIKGKGNYSGSVKITIKQKKATTTTTDSSSTSGS